MLIDREDDEEYAVVSHLNKILAKLYVLELIKTSPKHQRALYTIFNKAWVNIDISPEALGNVADVAFGTLVITFPNKDLPEPEFGLLYCI